MRSENTKGIDMADDSTTEASFPRATCEKFRERHPPGSSKETKDVRAALIGHAGSCTNRYGYEYNGRGEWGISFREKRPKIKKEERAKNGTQKTRGEKGVLQDKRLPEAKKK